MKTPAKRIGRGPTPLLTYGQAEAKAKRLLGPDAAVRFIRNSKSKGRKATYLVGLCFNDQVDGVPARLFGVVGEGPSWRKALADAATNMRKAVRESIKSDEVAK